MLDLEAIKARVEAATPGPWEFGHLLHNVAAKGPRIRLVAKILGAAHTTAELRDDGIFIAHAREDIPALVAEIERLRAELAARSGEWTHPAPAAEYDATSDWSQDRGDVTA